MHYPQKISQIISQKELLFYISFFSLICLIISSCFVLETSRATDGSKNLYILNDQIEPSKINGTIEEYIQRILGNYNTDAFYQDLTIRSPYDESIFPPEIAAPNFKWEKTNTAVDKWLLIVSFHKKKKLFYIMCSRSNWTPDKKTWKLMKHNSLEAPAQITILGVTSAPSNEVASKGIVNISISNDPVDASIMFRRVYPSFDYASRHPEQIQWVLGDISSYKDPSLIMSKQPVCGSCHSFSQDGTLIGMDMDYKNDKGAYLFTSVRENIELKDQDFISWNDFQRMDGLKNTGLYSRISPDGRHIASTVNEILFLIKIPDLYFSQLFFPLQGSLAVYSSNNKKVATLPGADLSDFIQTDPSWSPDGNHILFSRAPSKMDLFWNLGGKTVFSVENADIDRLNKQYPIKFDIYRIPFNNGKGGLAEPLPGASNNGKSNYYPRYSPDGKWIVFTQSESGLVIQQDSKLFIMPAAGGKAKKMSCNLSRVNSWHTWSPNSKWIAFVSKENTPFTELFLTHIDEQGNDSPSILLKRFNKTGYAINVPEFANMSSKAIKKITLKGK
ncbi:MAG: hypothetical protein K8S13_19090 [Desulfobacula sp.]|uniref:TolB family protein n=1 Tax=Desulfobacula sp. TaxID=2593537 RepID=UPI0025C3EEBB|nr:hypothetical protein [Desulfobacula sp.]MCD4721943.1 hypothetical protein [Desulfobacula sp.]